ncbi:hypothetical protein SAMN04488602_10964 [Paenibacillus sp. cl123]|nr:hypothetical protein SAMN04488602_10964 [Paenibacillus sp. cl123]
MRCSSLTTIIIDSDSCYPLRYGPDDVALPELYGSE